MAIVPVDVSDLMLACKQMFTEDDQISNLANVAVDVCEEPNESPTRCPWIGVYRTGVTFPSRALGAGAANRYNRVALFVMCTETGGTGEECAIALERLVQHVLRVLMGDETLKGFVDVLDEVEVSYPKYGLVDGAYLQTALIQVVGVTTVRGV